MPTAMKTKRIGSHTRGISKNHPLCRQLSLSLLNVKCRQNLEIRYYGANVVTSCFLDVHFVSPVPVECHARAGGHPVPMALGPWIPAFAGMTRGHKHRQGIYEMDI